jgi:adenine specific DNA methylase Mod
MAVNSFKERFYNLLLGMFVGDSEIEGQGGFVNLLKIKKKYFDSEFKPNLQKKIEEILRVYPQFESELFEKLYTFFSRYFSESGSIYFVNTPSYHQIYDRIYTDKDDVVLFWKTRDLYYIKTDRIFKSLEIKIEESGKEYKFYFDVSNLEYKRANEKREIIYELDEERTSKEKVYFYVYYSEKGRTTKIDEILKKLKKKEIKITEDILEKAFKRFEQQAEVDYFIHKNARAFLKEQLKLYIYNYLFKERQDWPKERLDQIYKFQEVAELIIDFVSKFEDELVKIWNKPRFVFNSNYVITLDRIVKQNKEKGFEVIEKIINHENFDKQVEEWKRLEIIDSGFDKDEIIQTSLSSKELNKKYQFLPIDTKYFKDLEVEILSLFDDLDNQLDGWLIKSENYQALNTILPKFKEKVQTIYIDPPFNKEQDADYLYNVKYKDSTWITLLENRLRLARDLLKDTGSIFVRCDYNGNMYVRLLMNEIFGEENFRNEIIIQRGLQTRKAENRLLNKTDSLFFYFKNLDKGVLSILETEKEHVKAYRETLNTLRKFLNKEEYQKIQNLLEETLWMPFLSMPGEQKTIQYREIFGIKLYPPTGRHWAFSQENLDIAVKNGIARLKCANCNYIITNRNKDNFLGKCPKCGGKNFEGEIFSLYNQINNNWTNIPGYEQDPDFPTRNSEILLKRVIESTSNEGDLVMDFFLGSGTATAAAHKLRRKWIGVEMGDHFWTIVLPRMKKVLFYDKSGISKEKDVKEKYNENNAGGFFKYYELEQYEEILRKAKYLEPKEHQTLFDKDFNYIFTTDPKLLDAIELDYENNKIKVDLTKIYPEKQIDIAETLSNLKGKWIKKISEDEVEFEGGEKANIQNLDYNLIKLLIWW